MYYMHVHRQVYIQQLPGKSKQKHLYRPPRGQLIYIAVDPTRYVCILKFHAAGLCYVFMVARNILVTYILNSSRLSVLPAEMDKRVIGLVDVQQTLALVGVDHFALLSHFSGPEFDQIFALAPTTTTSEQSSPRAAHLFGLNLQRKAKTTQVRNDSQN